MDAGRFDAFSRSLAERSSRRRALRALGGGGIGATLLGLAGLRVTAAQDETTTCRWQLVAEVAVGPNESATFAGELTLVIDPEGPIDAGELETDDGDVFEVVGQAVGRALHLRIEVDDDRVLALTGTAERDIILCRGRIDGTLGGPEMGDLGTWTATRRRSQSTSTPGTGDEVREGGSNASETGGSSGRPTPCPPRDCGSTFVFDSISCECICPAPYDRCGDVCCPGGSVCTDPASGSCSCPGTFTLCQERCVPSCEFGTTLDPNTCQCVLPSGGANCVDCNGVCTYLDSDAHNCGACGTRCPLGIPCTGGLCQCPPGYKTCPDGCCLA